MSLSRLKEAAARSVDRRSKKKNLEKTALPAPPAPVGVVKTTRSGRRYRVYDIPLSELPRFLEKNQFELIGGSYYVSEGKLILGVKKRRKKSISSVFSLIYIIKLLEVSNHEYK
jgi:hypothetical protein